MTEQMNRLVQTDHRLFDARVLILSLRHQCENPYCVFFVFLKKSLTRWLKASSASIFSRCHAFIFLGRSIFCCWCHLASRLRVPRPAQALQVQFVRLNDLRQLLFVCLRRVRLPRVALHWAADCDVCNRGASSMWAHRTGGQLQHHLDAR